MKKILIIALVLAFTVIPISAKDKKEPKYEVKISVVYNAVSIKDADRITANARREHVDACKVEITSKKVGTMPVLLYDGDSTTMVFDTIR